MKKLFILPLLAAVVALGFYNTSTVSAETHIAPQPKIVPAPLVTQSFEKPAYYAVKFHADTCGSCKIMAPEIAKAFGEGGLSESNVLYVKMDYTNKATIKQSKLRAAALGIDEYVKSKGAKTGYMALINGAGEELTIFTIADDSAKIAMSIKEKAQ